MAFTAISIPEGVYREMDKLSRKLGVPRSRLYARAAAEFLDRRRGEALTEAINQAHAGEMTEEEKGFVAGGMRALAKLGEGTW